MVDFTTLNDWLEHIERLHSKPIDMGLSRMKTMLERLSISFDCPVLTVAGTNGKGSTCAMLERILRSGGFRVGMHTSPHLLRFNERAWLLGREASDEELMAVFRQVENARGDMTLSYFEYTGLAILKLFQEAHLDAVILEIGLGGRLDAMNTVDPDVSIVTTVGIDHTAFLGDTREAIALEKAHIYRQGRPAICADPEPPQTLIDFAKRIQADLRLVNRDFSVKVHADGSFDYADARISYKALPAPGLVGVNQYRNAAGVLAVLSAVNDRLPLSREALEQGLRSVRITGRFEKVADEPLTILDVGHNPQAAIVLAQNIARTKAPGEITLAVFGMLKDKDMTAVSHILRDSFDEWFVGSLTGPRAATADDLARHMLEAGIAPSKIERFDSIAQALAQARGKAQTLLQKSACDIGGQSTIGTVRIIIFGSFVTVSSALECLPHSAPVP